MAEEYKVMAKRSEFKGHPMLVLTTGDNEKYPFQFGLGKARRIVACLDDIKKFVAEEDAKTAAAPK